MNDMSPIKDAPPALLPIREEVQRFLAVLFKHATPGTYVALRAFFQVAKGPRQILSNEFVAVDAPDLLDKACGAAARAANSPRPAAFYTPIATFKLPTAATYANTADAPVLSLECDDHPRESLGRIEGVLGVPTMIVESGGYCGVEPKLHLHYRLRVPARSVEERQRLGELRSLARQLAQSDPTCDPYVHPLRVAGSWHRKQAGTGRTAAIVGGDPDREIDLDEALGLLRIAVPDPEVRSARAVTTPEERKGEEEDIRAALKAIPNDDRSWDDWSRILMATFAASDGFALDDVLAWSAKSEKDDPEATEARWEHLRSYPPTQIGMGTLVAEARKAAPGWRLPSDLRRLETWFDPEAANAAMKAEADRLASEAEARRNEETEVEKAVAASGSKLFPLGGTSDAGAGKTKKRKKLEPPQRDKNDPRPTIVVRNGEIEEAVNAMEDALIARGTLYQRGEHIVGIGEVPVLTTGQKEGTAIRVIQKGEYAIAEEVSSSASVMRFDARCEKEVVVDPPKTHIRTLMQRTGRLRLPPLYGIVTAPTIRSDGSLLDTPGYDRITGLYYEPGEEWFPPIPREPSRSDAEAALAAIVDVIAHFPFVAEMDRSVAISAIVTACVRQALPTAPLHAFTAPVRGSGKSMLADVAAVIATGRPASVVAQTGDEIEMEKRLTGMLLQAAQITAIDNCTAPVDGVFLNMMMAQTSVTVRPLGGSTMIDVPSNTFVMAGGNGLVISGDMTRRSVVCSLDPRMERPELRCFDFNPVIRAKAERGRLVAAVLTILLAHMGAGGPGTGKPLGSFEAWSRSVRDALVWLGCADPLLTMEHIQDDDPEKTELEATMAKWSEKIGEDRVTVAQIIERVAAYECASFRADLLAIAGSGGTINPKRLGKWLGKNAKRRVGGRWIEACGMIKGALTWRLCSS